MGNTKDGNEYEVVRLYIGDRSAEEVIEDLIRVHES